MNIYDDLSGKSIEVGDRIHYATKGDINIGRVLQLLDNNKGIKIIGKKRKRSCTLPHPEKQVIITVKGYYNNIKKANRTNFA